MLSSARLTRFVGLLKGLVNQMFRPILVAVLLCLSIGAGVANAEKKIDLYMDAQLVLDQSDNLRQQAMRSSLATIFIRVTGNSQIVKRAVIVQALSKPGAYVSQYRYNSTDEDITIAGASRPAQELWLQFSKPAIQRVLQAAQLPAWSSSRPEILLWVAVNESGKRILSAESAPINTFKRIAKSRGLPLAIPLLDLADRRALTATRLWARDELAITRASARYGADGVLAGRIMSVSDGLQRGNFVLMYEGRQYDYSAEGESATVVIQKIMDQSVNTLANANAVIAVGDNVAPHIVMAVDNIVEFSSYAELLESLRDISSVRHVMVQEVNSHYLIIDLRYQGSATKLRSQLSSLPILQSMPVDQFLEQYPAEELVDSTSSEAATEISDVSPALDPLTTDVEPEVGEAIVIPAVTSIVTSVVPIIDVAFTWSGSASR
jgi:hypothetical protein